MKIYKKEIEEMLAGVSRPSRYCNSEWNSFHAENGHGKTSICLCYPDVYEIGVSNLSIEILYHCVNASGRGIAERCYCPEDDMEQLLRERTIPLCSLESSRSLADFDMVGFTLQHELCYTNVLHMLQLAAIPLSAEERHDDHPLVIGGGPCTANPEPISSFFDAFVLGDAEEAILEVMEAVAAGKKEHIGRKNMLTNLSKIPGVYIPSLYAVTYDVNNLISHIEPCDGDAPAVVQKRVVELEKAPYPEQPVVPFVQAVHDRLNLELARGCVHTCRFCQASRIHHPVRQRSVARLLEIAEKGLSSTGFEEIALSSLSSSDYSFIEPLLQKLIEKYAARRIALSLPSLRCNMDALRLAAFTRGVKKSSLTFAPEAGTSRMLAIINKQMDGDKVLPVIKAAGESGWKQIKLYFMYGLPWETDHDISGIIALMKKAKQENKHLNFNITISPFVPKPHTPFQWCGQNSLEILTSKKENLLRHIPGNIRPHDIRASFLEAVFCRGDRRLGSVLRRAYERGCRFDQWKERLRYDVWMNVFSECGIDPAWYAQRERGDHEVFPWEHLHYGVSRDALLAEYRKARDIGQTGDDTGKEVQQRSVPDRKNDFPRSAYDRPLPAQPVCRMRLRFRRSGNMRFLSQLEQITTFRRMFRRADLPLAYTQGFHPQPKISFGPAISVSYSSDAEYVDIELVRHMDAETVRRSVIAQLPAGFELLQIKRIPVFFPSLDASLNQVAYTITGQWPPDAPERIKDFLSASEFRIEKVKKDKKESINLTRVVRVIELHNSSMNLLLDYQPKHNVKPSLLIQKLFDIPEKEVASFHIHKVGLYIARRNQRSIEP